MLKYRIHGTRKAGNGIPVETCNSCAVFLYKDPVAAKAMNNTALTALSLAP